jgi:hypothetical protein
LLRRSILFQDNPNAKKHVFYLFIVPARMPETLRVEGGIGAPREEFGDFALNPQEKITASKRPASNYKKIFLIWLIVIIVCSTKQYRPAKNS